MHHIVSDGWSMGVLFRELGLLYESYCVGRGSPLPELSIQYADFAVWQREWLQGEVLARHVEYWREQLAGAPAVLQLPSDRVRPPVQMFHGASQPFVLSCELTGQLRRISQGEGVTLFMTLLAAFIALLYRYTGQGDVVVGTPIANRNQAELEELIGFFVNTLVLRVRMEDEPGFRELLRRVRETTLGAYAHQDLPFEKLVEELQPERSLSHNPLFQVMFVLQNTPGAALGSSLEPAVPEGVPLAGAQVSTAKFDLTLSMGEVGGQLAGVFEYNTDLFEAFRRGFFRACAMKNRARGGKTPCKAEELGRVRFARDI